MYVVELRINEGRSEVALARATDGPLGRGVEDVWSHDFTNADSARIVAALMMRRADRWSTWGDMAILLGTEFLTGVIENEVVEAACEDLRTRPAPPNDSQQRPERDLPVVWFSVHLDVSPRIVGHRSGVEFFSLQVGTKLAALRLWDWVRWQTRSFADWLSLAEERGAVALEILILDSTRIAEQQARLGGYAAPGRRPLRHWRMK